MRKLSFLADEILNREDLRLVVGGYVGFDGECGGKSETECKNSCSAGGRLGKCAWVAADVNRCKCATVHVE